MASAERIVDPLFEIRTFMVKVRNYSPFTRYTDEFPLTGTHPVYPGPLILWRRVMRGPKYTLLRNIILMGKVEIKIKILLFRFKNPYTWTQVAALKNSVSHNSR